MQKISLGKVGFTALVAAVAIFLPQHTNAADVVIFTDEEQHVISDRVMSLHMIYHTMADSRFTDLLQGENLTIAQWAKKAGVGSMRYPGGTTVKAWDWQNPSYSYTSDPWSPGYSGPSKSHSQAMGLNDYLNFVSQAEIKPHIGINNFSATKYNRLQDSIDRAAALVQYVVNAGHIGAIYYIGNEEDHVQGGADDAAVIDLLHAQAIKALDPTCKIIWNNNGANGQNVRRMLEQSRGWLDGVETHGKIGGNFSQWQTTTPMGNGNGQRYRTVAKNIRAAATRQGFPNIFIADNEYGGGDSGNAYQTSLIRTEQLQEMFIGQWDMSAFWNITAMLGGNRLRAIHFSWEMLGNAHGGTMLNITNNGSHLPGFAVKTDDNVQLFLLNKSSNAVPLDVDFNGLFTVKTDGSHSGESMVDGDNHWGLVQPLALTHSTGTFSGTLPALSFSRMVFPRPARSDTIPPAAPTGLTATYGNGDMVLDWADNAEGDFHEYRLYRSTISGRDFRLLDMNVAGSAYTDTSAVNGVNYYYKVEAVDTSENESASSAEAIGRMPAFEPVFFADFERSTPSENTTAANLNLSTIGGFWTNVPSKARLRRDNPPGSGQLHIISQALLVDQVSGGFDVKANFDSPIPLDGTEVQLDVNWRRFGNSAKNLKIDGRDTSGNKSFEILLSMDRPAGKYLRLGYVHSGSSVTFFPQGSDEELKYNGDTYQSKPDNIRLILSSTGYSLEFNYGEWISAEVPYNGAATSINKVVVSAASSQAGIWIDNLRVRHLIPPDDGSNSAPAFTSDPVIAPDATKNSPYSESLAGFATDPDGDTLTFSRVSGPAWLQVRSDGKIYGTPGDYDIDLNLFRVKVADPYGASHIVDMQVLVPRGPNHPPSFKNDPFTKSNATEEIPYGGSIAGSATDPEWYNTLTYSKTGGPAWLSIASNGSLSGTPSPSDVGLNQFTVTISDGEGGIDTSTLRIRVDETGILAGWNSFASPNGNSQNASETKDPTISGSLAFSTSGNNWSRGSANQGSADLTFGTVPVAPGNGNSSSDALRCRIAGEHLDFTITNNTPSSLLHLNQVSFDGWRVFQGSINGWSLSVLSGSDISTGAVSDGGFVKKTVFPSNSNFEDFDVSLASLTDRTLATGESATLRLKMGSTSGSGFTYLDNVALIGTTELIPEIEVTLPGEGNLTDGTSGAVFPDALGTSTSLIFTIRNIGAATLSNLSTGINGADAGDFSSGSFGSTNLEPSESTNLTVTFSAATAGIKAANLNIFSNDDDENPFNVALSGTNTDETALQSWADSFGLDGDSLLPTADDDGDLISLLEEYAYNLDPTAHDGVLVPGTGTSGRPSIRLVGSGDARRLQTEFVRRRSDPNLVYTIEFGSEISEDPLGGFSPATEEQSVTVIDENFHRVIVNDSATVQSHPCRFGRVKLRYSGGAP